MNRTYISFFSLRQNIRIFDLKSIYTNFSELFTLRL